MLDPGIFDVLERQKTGSGGEIQLTDAMNAMIETRPFYGYRFEGRRYDCGHRTGYIEANIALCARPARHERGYRGDAQAVWDIRAMKIVFVGTGYVGLVSGVCFSEFGYTVICVDKDKSKIDLLKSGKAPIYEPGLEAMMRFQRGKREDCSSANP